MNTSQWPPPGNQGNSPWAQQDPNWRPTEFQDVQGRDPRQPFGQPAPPPPSEEFLAPPKGNRTVILVVVGVVALIAAILLAMQFLGKPGSEASPTPTAPVSAQPTATRTGNYIPFEGNGNGTFEILSSEWRADELRIRIRVEVEQGSYGFGLFAFTNHSRESYDPIDLRTFTVTAGEPFETDVTFRMPREDSTIVLSTPSGRVALNGLPVKR